jgi:hypothetical protein
MNQSNAGLGNKRGKGTATASSAFITSPSNSSYASVMDAGTSS